MQDDVTTLWKKLNQLDRKLEITLFLLYQLTKEAGVIMHELDILTDQVRQNTDIEASAVLLIQGLAAKIDANVTDPAALAALSASLKLQADNLAAAIAANTGKA